MRVSVHVTPKAGRDEIVGWRNDALWVRVRSAPEGGRANVAVCRLIAAVVGVPRSAVQIAGGAGSRTKLIDIDAEDERVIERIGRAGSDTSDGDEGSAGGGARTGNAAGPGASDR